MHATPAIATDGLVSHAGEATPEAFGAHLRRWRQLRGLSQLALALEAGSSPRHLSFLETGRALPSREMLLRLAERLMVPPPERNAWLVAAGFAPMYRQRPFDHPDLAAARAAVERVLAAHEPYPALAIDRHWQLVAANRAAMSFLQDIPPALLEPPLNVLRLSLQPEGLASRIVNLGQWRAHLFERLAQQVQASGDRVLAALLEELQSLPVPSSAEADEPTLEGEHAGVVIPLLLRSPHGLLRFISTTTVFGTPMDLTLQGLAIETLLPADAATAEVLREIAARAS
jgi:transcriptional regulator with XRE-family HTH domain